MTIEEEFFKTFGIEPIEKPSFGDIECDECFYGICDACGWTTYPEITDRVLLELICILNKHYSEHYQIASMIVGKNIEEVKKSILNDCIEQCKHKDFKHQVQLLFKGVEE